MSLPSAIQKLQDQATARSHHGGLFPAGLVAARDYVDIDEMAAAVKNWNHEGVQLSPGAFRGQLLLAHTASMQIHRARLSPEILIRGFAVPGSIVFGIQSGGANRGYWRGEVLRPTDGVTLDGSDEIDFRTTGPTELIVVSVDRSLLGEYLDSIRASLRPADRRRSRLTFLSPIESQWVTRRWKELAACTLHLARRLENSHIARHFEAEMLHALLAKAELEFRDDSRVDRRLAANRAHRYMTLNLDVPMTIKDICKAVGAAERTLHLGFRECFGTTPKRFLKTLRLNATRRDLQHPDHQTTVTDVALRWGLVHLARFAGDYRKLFLESPSETLRRAAGAETCHGVSKPKTDGSIARMQFG